MKENIMQLTATKLLEIAKTNPKFMTGANYKQFVKTIMDCYGVDKNDAFALISLLQDSHIKEMLRIIAKYEKKQHKE